MDQPRDQRSKRVVFISHCILNINTLAQGLRRPNKFHSMINPLVELLINSNVGIHQLPCPEKAILGLVREPKDKKEMPANKFKRFSRNTVKKVIKEIQEYIDNDFNVVAIIGIEGSPTCGVTLCHIDGKLTPSTGFFMEELRKALKKANLDIPMVGFIGEGTPNELAPIEKLLKN